MGDITEYFSDLSEVSDIREIPLHELVALLETLENLTTCDLSVVTEALESVPAMHNALQSYRGACEDVRYGNRQVYSVLSSLRISSFKSIIGENTYV